MSAMYVRAAHLHPCAQSYAVQHGKVVLQFQGTKQQEGDLRSANCVCLDSFLERSARAAPWRRAQRLATKAVPGQLLDSAGANVQVSMQLCSG